MTVYYCRLYGSNVKLISILFSETKVQSGIRKLQEMFLELINATRVAIVNEGIEMPTVISCVRMFRYDPVEDQDKTFLIERDLTLCGLKNVEVLFDHLSVHWNYLHTSIYGHLIKVFTLSIVNDQYTEYHDELDTFLRRTCVIEFCMTVENIECQDEMALNMAVKHVSKHKWDPPVHLNQVNCFRKQNVNYCNLPQCVKIVVAKIWSSEEKVLRVLKIIWTYPELNRQYSNDHTEVRGSKV